MGFAATTLANAAASLIAWAVEQVYGSGSADVLRERVRERLGRQPHKLSLQLALARTEERFAREHPTWHARFFDMVFLCGPAVPLLGRALTSTENVTASELAQAWGEHFGGKTGRGLAEEAEGPAEDFLKWWHEELRRLEVFREPLDSRALDHIAQSTQETVDQLRGLHAQLLDALAERDAAVLRSRYPDLDDFLDWPSHRLEPAAAQFVGREWVFRFLDEFAAAHRSGYVRIIADAGLGKTALAAAVAGRYGAPAFFFSETAGRTRADQCLNHLAVELILDRQLAYEHLPEHAGQSASFLARLLHEVAAAARPVWVVIDALDEVDCSSGGTRLPLPDRLPGGAFVVLTHRDGVPAPLVAPGSDTVVKTLSLGAAGCGEGAKRQRGDVTAYLRNRVRHDMAVAAAFARATPALTPEQAVELLATVSDGNFTYLVYALQDIVEDSAPRLDAAVLPRGLSAYCEAMWTRMRPAASAPDSDWELWERLRRPVLERLAVAGEPVTLRWLADHTGKPPNAVRGRALDAWERFVAHADEPHADEPRWGLIHQSFRDFLAGANEVDLDAAHAAVADHYVSEQSRWDAHDGYALRHLSTHLRAAGDHVRLFSLIDDATGERPKSAPTPARVATSMTSRTHGRLQRTWTHATSKGPAAGALATRD